MDVIDFLSSLVLINSVYPKEQEIGRFVEQRLIQDGFVVKRQRVDGDRFNLLAEKGNGSAVLLFGHLDTVENQEGWKTDPYKLTKKGDALHGLGAWDMKAGLAAMLTAVQDFKPTETCLKMAFLVDEENVSLGMDSLIKEKWLEGVAGAVTPEPGFNFGLSGIALGRIGRVVYHITVITEGGHVYLADQRQNAILELPKVLAILDKVTKVSHSRLGESLIIPRFVQGGAQSMSIPGQVILEIECRLVPPQTPFSLINQIRTLLKKARETGEIRAEVEIELIKRPTPFCEPFEIDKQDNFVLQTTEALRKTIGKDPTYYYRQSVGDENRIAKLGIPVLTVGPDGGNAHQPNEWVSEKSLYLLVKFFQNLITDYASS